MDESVWTRAALPVSSLQDAFGEAAAICRIDREIGVIRLKMASILRNDPENSGALCLEAHLLDNMLRARKSAVRLFRKAEDDATFSEVADYVLTLLPALD